MLRRFKVQVGISDAFCQCRGAQARVSNGGTISDEDASQNVGSDDES